MFRFQTGAIKSTFPIVGEPQVYLRFRFQTGAIKSEHIDLNVVVIPPFRFQTGAIKRWQGEEQWTTDDLKFRFQTGAIKSRKVHTRAPRRYSVSIPNWCD